jgi:MoxR-like ATPase
MSDAEKLQNLHQKYKELKDELSKVIIGQNDVIEQLFIAMISRGHALLVGVPGLAKTLLIKSFADVSDLAFNRVQFTPDLMPSDITGTEIIEEDHTTGKRVFKFVKGPIFANMVLADEINRTPPKTQAALLEAMQEHSVTTGGKTHVLDEPFFVLATQNPIEQEGTYPLPEAQLDRFMFKLRVEYPSRNEEINIVRSTTTDAAKTLKKIMNKDDIIAFQDLVRKIPVSNDVISYAVDLVAKTRPGDEASNDNVRNWVAWGAGPRASQYLILGAKALAALQGNPTPTIDDVKHVALPVLRHRVLANFNAEADGVSVDEIIQKLLD